MKDYQPKKTPYILDRETYLSTLWMIRSYYKCKTEVNDSIGLSAVVNDGQPHGNGVGDPTARKAEKLHASYAYRVVSAVDEALTHIQEDMRKGVWESVMWKIPYPLVPSERTWGREKAKFVYLVHQIFGQYETWQPGAKNT